MSDLEPQTSKSRDLSLSGENPLHVRRLEVGRVNFADVHRKFIDMQRQLLQDLGPNDTVQSIESVDGNHIGIIPKTIKYKDRIYNSFVILANSLISGSPYSESFRIDLPIELADPSGNQDLVNITNRIHIERSIENPTEKRTEYETDTLYPDKQAKTQFYSEPYLNQTNAKSTSTSEAVDTVLDPSWVIQRISEIHQMTKKPGIKTEV